VLFFQFSHYLNLRLIKINERTKLHAQPYHRQRVLSRYLFVHGLRTYPQQVWLYLQKNCPVYSFSTLLHHRVSLKCVQSILRTKRTKTERLKLIMLRRSDCELFAVYCVQTRNGGLLYSLFLHDHGLQKD